MQENQSLTRHLEKSCAPIILEEATLSGMRANPTQTLAPTTALKSIKAIKQHDASCTGQVLLKSKDKSKVFSMNHFFEDLNIPNYD